MKKTPVKPPTSNGPFCLILHPNDQKGTQVVFRLIVVAWLFLVLMISLMKFSTAITVKNDSTVLNNLQDLCNFQLVESLPQDMPYGPNSSAAKPLYQAWMELLNMTHESIHVVSYYWTLTGKDLDVNDTSSQQGEEILKKLESLLSENISMFIATSVPSKVYHSTDLKVLEGKGAHVKWVNFGHLTHGVLHTKFWIVDRKHIFLGSPNVDWRALTQVKEIGVLISNCGSLANDLWKTFQTYWDLGVPNATIPFPWPSNYSTNINRRKPLEVQFNGTTTKAYFSASPFSFCPEGRTFDLVAVLDVINDAEEFVYVSMMEYFPTSHFRHPPRYWPPIDNALRRAAVSYNVHVRLLISCWIHTVPSMFHYLKSLSVLTNPHTNVTIDVKIFIVPVGNHTNIPFARLNHGKYMVTDKTAYVGTSNWAEEYFSSTAGVGLVAQQSSVDPAKRNTTIQQQLRSLFERDWNSKYSVNMEDLPGQKDCVWKDGFQSL
uniref:5'-3' exonuclease PLD4 isoform X1 n=2 Tax=Pogona vitticeps TaxID=103695 RepID=A0ABM5FBR7_9SAUR